MANAINEDLLLNEIEVARLRERVSALGETKVADQLRINRGTLLRVLCRLPVRYATITVVRLGLAGTHRSSPATV